MCIRDRYFSRLVFNVKVRSVQPFEADLLYRTGYTHSIANHRRCYFSRFAGACLFIGLLVRLGKTLAAHPCESHGNHQQHNQAGDGKPQKTFVACGMIMQGHCNSADGKSHPGEYGHLLPLVLRKVVSEHQKVSNPDEKETAENIPDCGGNKIPDPDVSPRNTSVADQKGIRAFLDHCRVPVRQELSCWKKIHVGYAVFKTGRDESHNREPDTEKLADDVVCRDGKQNSDIDQKVTADGLDEAGPEARGSDCFVGQNLANGNICLLYTSPSPRDRTRSRMPSSA